MDNTKKDILWRLYLSLAAFVVLGLGITAQIINIQFVQGDAYRAMADSARVRTQVIEPKRGSIMSEHHDILATSFPYYKIYMDPVAPNDVDFKKNIDSLSIQLANLFRDKTAAQYKQKITQARKQKKRYIEIYKKATLPQKQKLENFALYRLGKNRGGLITEQIENRAYPYNSLANRTIGYVKDGRKIGLEGTYDTLLTGKEGYTLMRKIAGGSWMPISDKNEVDPVDGVDVITTLDINMQDITETALRRSLVKNDAAWGTAIVMEVKTGKIKAIANLTRSAPGFYKEDYNYAISTKVEPGSTWKLFSLMCLLEDGLSITDHVDLNQGTYLFADRTMRDSEPHSRRNVTVETAFALSSNVGISRLAYDYYQKEPQKYIDHLIQSGIANKTGIEISGEPKPYFKKDPKDKELWYKTTIPWMSVGYELTVTPLQLLTFYNGIANDGKMMKPYLVQETQQYGATIQEFEPIVLNEKLCSKSTVDQLQECMLAVVDSGTAKHLKNEYYQFAGKTGTAQLVENGVYGHNHLASFAGYFPYENPKYSIVVIISDPNSPVYYGGYVSAPVFREISDKVYSHFINMREPVNMADTSFVGVTASAKGNAYDFRQILKWLNVNETFDDNEEWIAINTNGKSSTHELIKTYQYTMPNVKGMGLRDAMYLLESNGLKVGVSGSGKVTSQSVEAGQAINKGTFVSIQLN
ncbi:MAG: transpeptidase family protein [Bacteroidetes bacterium]|nr:transpeptidase family protein [Bacteroidota bacterium]